jgi:MFS family permease
VTVSYLLLSTVAAPVFGRLAELYPRKQVLLGALGLFVGGSVLCGLTPTGSFGWLVISRGIQGAGGGALFTLAFTTLAWLFPPRERSRWAGLIGAVFGLAAALGPPLGGFLTEKLGWRWTFWINLPLGAMGILLIARFMPKLPPLSQGQFDWKGAILIPFAIKNLLNGERCFGRSAPSGRSGQGRRPARRAGRRLSMGPPPAEGGRRPHKIPPTRIQKLFASNWFLGGIAFYLWLRVERRASSPLFDLSYLRLPSFRYAALAAFWFGPLFFGVITFLPLYLQKVLGQPPALSGRYLLILTAVSVGSTAWVGARVSRHGRYKPFLVGGSVGLSGVLGTTAVFLPESVSGGVLAGVLALAGLTTGPMQALLGVVAQNDVPISRVGSVSSAVLFARQMGASWGLAAWNALYTYGLHQSGDIRIGLQAAFAGMAILSLILVLTLLLLPDHRLRRRHIEEELAV